MTEIPEHLLKRSQSARAKADGAPAPAETSSSTAVEAVPTAAAPAAKAAAASAPAAPPPPKPDSAVVAAYKSRKKIPVWAMATLSILPVWMLMYVQSVTETEAEASTPLSIGTEEYLAACSTCHGAEGGGGSGRQFSDGEILATFPRIEDHLNFFIHGSDEYEAAGVIGYGDPNREGGQHELYSYNGAAMPALGGLADPTDYEILAVVCHERYDLGGADPESDTWSAEFAKWCAPDAPVWEELRAGELMLADIPEVGPEPRAPLADQTPGAVTEGE
jgi:mono/diheme cytochrome c family protein